MRYDPNSAQARSFHDAALRFALGQDTPSAYLERCLAPSALRDPAVRGFAVHEALARAAADASSRRWRIGQPMSAIDGMPIAVGLSTDRATERALLDAGAVRLGRTEWPAPAVAAAHCSAALDTAPRGGVIRSASACGNFAFVPTHGSDDQAETPAHGPTTPGVQACSVDDLWQVVNTIAVRGRGGLAIAPEPLQPRRLIVIEAAEGPTVHTPTRTAFEALMDQLGCAGVTLLRRRDDPAIEAFEQAMAAVAHHAGLQLEQTHPVSMVETAHAALAPLADALIMLSAPGPAPMGPGQTPGKLLNAPAVGLPLMSVDGMPVGAQLVGQRNQDARVLSLARWVTLAAGTVVV